MITLNKTLAPMLMASFFVISCSQPAEQTAESTGTAPGPGQSAVVDEISQPNIVQVAIGSKDHTTLVTAVKAAELVDVLSNAGPFTVFAPVNAAFDALPAGTVEELLKPENKGKLQDILQHHVAVAVYKIENFYDGQVLGMVDGNNVTFSVKDGKVMIGDANIVASVPASNGIIHVIDKVILP
ncbi:MAG: fasciclin domain-containing protein [Bacteroidia bacterium]|nr:fasciclin domain-containing protein [Bacteroidia bacterium]